MYLSYDITRGEPLKRKVWTFVLYSTTFVLSEYKEQYKLPPSTNWRNKHQYDRLLANNNTIEDKQIEIPDDVKAELLQTHTEQLTVKIWKDYSKPKDKSKAK
jgi:hypothetical protein